MRADSRIGGHFVQGHIDGTGVVDEIRPDGDSHWLTISFDRGLSPYLIRKGSIAVDGVSLTVAGLGGNVFDAMIIPFTWANTNLSSLRLRDRVNLECDMIGKYVARAVELMEEGRLKPALRHEVGPAGQADLKHGQRAFASPRAPASAARLPPSRRRSPRSATAG